MMSNDPKDTITILLFIFVLFLIILGFLSPNLGLNLIK